GRSQTMDIFVDFKSTLVALLLMFLQIALMMMKIQVKERGKNKYVGRWGLD
ncbi:hypothetical protein KI387_022589, partial [Taxus chinensis]